MPRAKAVKLNMRMLDEVFRIRENIRLTPHLFKVTFACEKLARVLKPGQFLQIAVTEHYDPFLRRPFTIYRVSGRVIEILYEIVGRGTEILSRLKKGDPLKVMGPLGNTFTLNSPLGPGLARGPQRQYSPGVQAPGEWPSGARSLDKNGRVNVIVGGGVGIAPFIFLGQRLAIDHFLMGARTRDGLLPRSEMGGLWKKAHFSTEDGSYGKKGFITACLEDVIKKEINPKDLYLYVCGPRAMMKAVMEMAARYGISGEASLDERMACGVGACLGCVVHTKHGYKTSCREGTVFRFEELML